MIKKISTNKKIAISEIGNTFKIDTTNIPNNKNNILGKIVLSKEYMAKGVTATNPKTDEIIDKSISIKPNAIMTIEINNLKDLSFIPDFITFELKNIDTISIIV